MKKVLIAIFLVVATLFSLCSCSALDQLLPFIEELIGGTGEIESHVYTDFTPAEKELIKKQVGEDIPFIPNDEYYLEEFSSSEERGVNFYTYGNTEDEFIEYRGILSGYQFVGTSRDSYGTTWYVYENNGVFYEIAYYPTEDGDGCIDLYVYVQVESGNQGDDNTTPGGSDDNQGGSDDNQGGNNDNQGGSDDNQGGSQDEKNYTYTGFSDVETELFEEFCEFVIPFIPNDEYYVEEFSSEGWIGINFYAIGNTEADFVLYKGSFSVYTFVESYEDDYGDTWYTYEKDGFYIDIAYYYAYEYGYLVDVYVYTTKQNDDDNGGNNGGNTENHLYTDFTSSEKEIFDEFCGFVIPFIPNDEYYVKAYNIDGEVGINFYSLGNTEADFISYKDSFSAYTFVESYEDDYGDTWYTYEKDGFYIDISYYYYDSEYGYLVDVYVYTSTSNDDDNGGNTENHLYTDFTSSEKAMFNEFCGFVIPFIPNDGYNVEEYTYEDEIGINFYTAGNTSQEFNAYKSLYSGYTFVESYADDYGDTWYTYEKDGFYIDIAYYYYDSEYGYLVDVYVYTTKSNDDDNGGNGGNDVTDLPSDEDGVFDVDFTDATNVKNVTDQGYYLDGCPTTGSPAVLVIPVEFRDVTAASKGYTTEAIKNAFMKNGQCDYYSVYDYYYISSYGQLTLDITVLDYWFKPQYASTYYANATIDYFGEKVFGGDQLIMNEALAYLASRMDLSKFDSDNNGAIDAVVFINTLEIGNEDFYWAYRYWNIYADGNGYYYEYDGVSANDYMWASYQFLYESSDGQDFDDTSAMNTYTYIHEFGHVLGSDDYYDTAGVDHPMDGCDVMDAMKGDHNAFTKFNYGWLTTSRLVVTDTSVTLTLEDFSKNGDTIIIANSWDEKLGAYQEYYIVVYYTSNGLNNPDIGGGYFARDGIVVYHVNATLYSEVYDGETYYDIYNNNTNYSDEYGTKNNLIEFVTSANDTFTYVAGDTLPSVTDDNGNSLGYTFTVDSLDGEYATITFTKR